MKKKKYDAREHGKIIYGKLTQRQKRLWRLQLFFIRLALFSIPVYMIISLGVDMGPLQLEVARESHWLLNASGLSAELHGAGIILNMAGRQPFFFTISADCTGWKAMLFMAALMLAVPRRKWKARAIGVAAGLSALWLVNLLRVFAVVATFTVYGYDAAMLVHDYIWQVGMGAAALIVWIAWLKLSKG